MEHIVLLKFKAGTATKKITAALAEVQALDQKVSCIRHMRCGESFTTERAKGFTHALVCTLGCEADLPAYANNEAHTRLVSEHLKPILDDILVVVHGKFQVAGTDVALSGQHLLDVFFTSS